MSNSHKVITLPDGTKCYSGPNCRTHAGAIAAMNSDTAAAHTVIVNPEAFELALKQADHADQAKPTEVLAKGLQPRILNKDQARTYADLLRSGDKGARVVTSVDMSTPPGYFIASTKMLGLTTEYLVQGTEGDPKAPIVGRIELRKSRGSIYRGNELKGGEYLGSVGGNFSNLTFADAFDAIALGPEPLPTPPARTPGVFGEPAGIGEAGSFLNRDRNYDVASYTANSGTAPREVRTNGEFKKAIQQVRAEKLGLVRVVRAKFDFNGKHGFFGVNKPEVFGPQDGTPLVIDMGRHYTSLDVTGGNVVINAEGLYGGGVTVRKGAAVTIITPPGKFTIDVEAGASVTVFPRAGARGGVWSAEGASVQIDDLYPHDIQNHVRPRSQR